MEPDLRAYLSRAPGCLTYLDFTPPLAIGSQPGPVRHSAPVPAGRTPSRRSQPGRAGRGPFPAAGLPEKNSPQTWGGSLQNLRNPSPVLLGPASFRTRPTGPSPITQSWKMPCSARGPIPGGHPLAKVHSLCRAYYTCTQGLSRELRWRAVG